MKRTGETEEGRLLRGWSVENRDDEKQREKGKKKASFEGQMRMTAKCGREERREKKKSHAFLTEATWQDHTAIFHSHSSAFAHDFKR